MGELKKLINKLNDDDAQIIRQLIAIIYKYLEKRGRL